MQITNITVADLRIICKYEDVEKSHTSVHNQLRSSGLRVTPARQAVLELLQTMRKPFTAADIIGLLRSKHFDQATVYRTLAALVEQSLVRTVSVREGVTSYEAGDLPHHHHLICERCGYVEDVQGCALQSLPPVTDSGFDRVTEHKLEFSGICQRCAVASK